MNQKQYSNWLGGFNPGMENQWNIQQQYRQQMQQQNAQQPPQHQQQQWQQQQCGNQDPGQQCYHQQCNGGQGRGQQQEAFNYNQLQNQSLTQPPRENIQNGYHQMNGQQINTRKRFINNLLYNPEEQFTNPYHQQHGENRNDCQQENSGQGYPGRGSGPDHRQAMRPQPWGRVPPSHPTEFRYHPRPQGFLPRANFVPNAHGPLQPLVQQYHPRGPFHQGTRFPISMHPQYLGAPYPINHPWQFPMTGGQYQDWPPGHYGGYGYPPSFQAGANLPRHLQKPDAQDYQLPHAQCGEMLQDGQGPPVPGDASYGREHCGNHCQQPQVNHVSCGGGVKITKVKTPNSFSILEKSPMRYMNQLEKVYDSVSRNHPLDNRLWKMRNQIYTEQENNKGKQKFSSEQLLMPKILSKRNNLEEWRVELDCPGWQNAFLQVELEEENSSSTHEKNKNWIYVRGKRDVQTKAGSVLVKFEKKFEAPISVDRTFVRAEMTKKGKLAIIADKKQKGIVRGVQGIK